LGHDTDSGTLAEGLGRVCYAPSDNMSNNVDMFRQEWRVRVSRDVRKGNVGAGKWKRGSALAKPPRYWKTK
jgi:hypothetical protein